MSEAKTDTYYKMKLSHILTTWATSLIVVSCGGSHESQSIAQALLQQANDAAGQHNYSLALELLDSLDNYHHDDIAAMRASRALRPECVIGQSQLEIDSIDAQISQETATLEIVAQKMRHVDVPGTDGYYVAAKGYDPNFMSTTGLSARVDDIGQFYLVTSVNPSGSLHHRSVTLVSGDRSISSGEIDNEMSGMRIGGSEILTLTPAMSSELGQFVDSLPTDAVVKVKFNGATGRTVTAAVDKTAFLTAWEYSTLINELRFMALEKDRLHAKIETARRQLDRINDSDLSTDK